MNALRRILPIVLIRALTVLCLSLAGGMLLPLSFKDSVVFAQDDDAEAEVQSDPEAKRRASVAMREKTYKKLSEAQAKAEAEDFAGALKIIDEVRADTSLNSYEIAMTWNFTAYIYSAQEKYPEALKAYEQLMAQPNIPEALQQSSIYTMANLYLATEQYQKAVDMMKRWFKIAKTPTSSAYITLGQAYYQLEQYKQAIDAIEKALVLVREQNGQPPEQALLILRAGYFELENMPKVMEVLEMLVNLYPKGQYFSQLAILYGERGDEKRQLLTLEAAYDGGYLNTQAQYVTLASLLVNSEVPYKAAKILSAGIDKKIVKDTVNHLRLLAQAWLLAQEPRKAITVLARAAKESEDGELYLTLGRSYADLDEWKECTEAARAGLKKGKLERIDSAYVILGTCLYNADDLDGAIAAFENARKDERSAKVAFQWTQFLRAEKERRQRIANSLL
jgi:tetratricopeptide (TPR) repeat protein